MERKKTHLGNKPNDKTSGLAPSTNFGCNKIGKSAAQVRLIQIEGHWERSDRIHGRLISSRNWFFKHLWIFFHQKCETEPKDFLPFSFFVCVGEAVEGTSRRVLLTVVDNEQHAPESCALPLDGSAASLRLLPRPVSLGILASPRGAPNPDRVKKKKCTKERYLESRKTYIGQIMKRQLGLKTLETRSLLKPLAVCVSCCLGCTVTTLGLKPDPLFDTVNRIECAFSCGL